MINEQVKEAVHYSFNTNGDADYLKIAGEHGELFWNWFYANAKHYEILSAEKGYADAAFLRNRCIGNSQIGSVRFGLHYVEGFASSDGQSYLFHGFNLLNGHVVDVTLNSNPEAFEKSGVLSHYLGIEIPLDFVMSENSELINDNSLNIPPLLYRYFLSKNVL
ncbi:hypothetical protein [Pedobacter metabolipauper]|uniref:Uncharacterized protein n=1 Tax=Pedobacter metabolipauper TaxID=425513 RepID=A0A4V3D1L9_9SPHI|nr:hypothetical protein [Pedobacter metabolipauper]TDQ11713.1 hypothetical protein ATK78_0838 [Pedobacter metabolipauper]